MTEKRIKEILSTYGKHDYYDQASGKIYKFSEMQYHLFYNKTFIPVDGIGIEKEEIILEGNYEIMA